MIYGMRSMVEWVIKHEAKLSALSATRPQPEHHKSRKARHDNIKWFKVFAIGAGPRFTKLSSLMRSPHYSAVSHRQSSLTPILVVSQSVFLATREVMIGSLS